MSDDDKLKQPAAPSATLPWPVRYGNLAQIASAVISSAAFVGIIIQLNLVVKNSEIVRTNAQVANARQVYLAYNEATLKYPEYADPDYAAIKKDPVKLAQYRNFIGSMLWAYDEILTVAPSPEWEAGFEYDLPPHMPYLCEENDPKFYAMYHAALRARLTKLKEGCPAR